MFPDLRYSNFLRTREGFETVVLGGVLTQNGMVSFKKALQPDQVDAIRAYIVSRAIDLKAHPSAPPRERAAQTLDSIPPAGFATSPPAKP
jgi:mono/diheme cytochrome c family protein